VADPVSRAPLAPETLTDPRTVELADVERELANLRCTPLGRAPRQQPMTRACMSNLIVYCDTREQLGQLPREFSDIAKRHPARVIILVGTGEGLDTELDTQISAEITKTSEGEQISSEQIRICASEAGQPRLPSAARSLLIGDLPTSLWWTSTRPPSSSGDFFLELEKMADSVVYDSRGWPDPRGGVISTAAWALGPKRQKLVADLAWLRLRHWRRLVAETFAPHILPGAMEGIDEIEIDHGPHALPMAWLFVGWLAHSLGWSVGRGQVVSQKENVIGFDSAMGRVQIRIRREDEGPPDICRILVKSQPEASTRILGHFQLLENGRLSARIEQGHLRNESIIATPDDPRVVMLTWQLTNRSGQPLFRRALEMATRMAKEIEN
jgi:glucose-6-phosphate dehydrogenase assembly protein OpcA